MTRKCATRTRNVQVTTEVPAPGPDTRLDRLVRLLVQPEGASITEMTAATGWQAHSVRGALAGPLKRRGHAIVSEKVDGIRRYRIRGGL